jgi:hypothetical protein
MNQGGYGRMQFDLPKILLQHLSEQTGEKHKNKSEDTAL